MSLGKNSSKVMLTPNFSEQELACKCGCNKCEMDIKFLWRLEHIRSILGKPLIITSGYRCKKYNDSLKESSKTSRHLSGTAVDIKCEDAADRFLLLRAAFTVGMNGVGVGDTFIHIDSRDLPGKIWLY